MRVSISASRGSERPAWPQLHSRSMVVTSEVVDANMRHLVRALVAGAGIELL
jgi:hypothetical protein